MRLTRLTSSVLVAPAVALVLALTTGCSAQTSTPEDAARQVVQSVLDKDSEALCDLVASSGERPTKDEKRECVDGLAKEIEVDSEERKNMESFLEEGAEKVEEDGDRATVTLADSGALGFVKIDDTWYWDPLA